MVGLGIIDDARGKAAMEILAEMPLERHLLTPLLPRMWELRRNVTAYDAARLALADALDCALITFDRALAAAPSMQARVAVPAVPGRLDGPRSKEPTLITDEAGPFVYLPLEQMYQSDFYVSVRAGPGSGTAAAVPELRRAILEMDPKLSLQLVTEMASYTRVGLAPYPRGRRYGSPHPWPFWPSCFRKLASMALWPRPWSGGGGRSGFASPWARSDGPSCGWTWLVSHASPFPDSSWAGSAPWLWAGSPRGSFSGWARGIHLLSPAWWRQSRVWCSWPPSSRPGKLFAWIPLRH
jgi:hypothetical protein